MPRFIDLTGLRFHRLLVIERQGTRWKQPMWLCVCDCGKRKIIDGNGLRRERAKSCGCFSAENGKRQWAGRISPNRKPLGMASARATWLSIRRGADKRSLEFAITFDEFLEIAVRNCVYCGVVPSSLAGTFKRNGSFTYNGMDRVDNSLGYTLANVVPCCTKCNIMKGKSTVAEFLDQCHRILEYREVRHARTLDSVEDHANGSRPDLGRGAAAVVAAGIFEPVA